MTFFWVPSLDLMFEMLIYFEQIYIKRNRGCYDMFLNARYSL